MSKRQRDTSAGTPGQITVKYMHLSGMIAHKYYKQAKNQFEFIVAAVNGPEDFISDLIQNMRLESGMHLSIAYVDMPDGTAEAKAMQIGCHGMQTRSKQVHEFKFIIGFCLHKMLEDGYIFIHWLVSRPVDASHLYRIPATHQPSGFKHAIHKHLKISGVRNYRSKDLQNQLAIYYLSHMPIGFKLCALVEKVPFYWQLGYRPDLPNTNQGREAKLIMGVYAPSMCMCLCGIKHALVSNQTQKLRVRYDETDVCVQMTRVGIHAFAIQENHRHSFELLPLATPSCPKESRKVAPARCSDW
jgi:hypothetical protein